MALEQRQQDNNEYAWIGVTDSQGLVLLQATGGLLVGQQVAQRPWFQAARTGPYIGDVHDALLLFGLFAALLFTFIAYRFAARISRPIEQLASAVHQIELRDGSPVYPEPAQIGEIDQLNRSIQSMTGSLLQHEHELEALNASLEQQVRDRTVALSLANQELERLATIDALTGLILIDADHFKQINDKHGHQAGDEVLRQLGRLLGQCTRITDFVARYGGEEFVVLLPDLQNETEGLAVAEKIRRAVADASFPVVGQITVSLGLSCARATDAAASEVVERADKALYTAKELGRDRVVTF